MKIESNGVIVEDYLTKETLTLGSPGITVFDTNYTKGDLKKIQDNPNDYNFAMEYDCPFLFPLRNNENHDFLYKGLLVSFSHVIKKRGQQQFSTLDILRLPYFSHIQIRCNFLSEIIDINSDMSSLMNVNKNTWDLIVFLNNKINDLIIKEDDKIDFEKNKILSYRMYFCKKTSPTKMEAMSIIPYTSVIDLKGPNNTEYLDENLLRLYLHEKLQLKNYYNDYLPNPDDKLAFEEKVFRIVHDFAFYSSERPEALSKLNEELIRDLFLVPLKMFFPTAEAEVFNYDGKLDFKITNPKNRYDIIAGEFKKWSGNDSFDECLMQATEKHVNGSECNIYMLFINNNKDVKKTYQKILQKLTESGVYIKEIDNNIALARNQFFSKHYVDINNFETPLILGIINTYYKKV